MFHNISTIYLISNPASKVRNNLYIANLIPKNRCPDKEPGKKVQFSWLIMEQLGNLVHLPTVTQSIKGMYQDTIYGFDKPESSDSDVV